MKLMYISKEQSQKLVLKPVENEQQKMAYW